MKGFLCLILIQAAFFANAERYNYSTLQTIDYDQMRERVEKRVRKAKEILRKQKDISEPVDQEAVEELREALQLVLSRPNYDNMLSKLMPEVRKELSTVNAFDDSLHGVVADALSAIDNEHLTRVDRATSLIVLENVLSEFKPEISDNEELKKIFMKIRDANIKIPKEVQNELRMRSMVGKTSPSLKAKKYLDKISK